MERSTQPFPSGFLMGAATAAHQVEGGNRLNDWWPMEEGGLLPHRSGDACRHFELYERDFDLARSFGHTAHRLSLEWSRIEPEPGRFDEAALAHYDRVLDALRRRGLEPVVTLHHFTNPAWFGAQGGWLDADSLTVFERYVRKVVGRYHERVRWWITVNEPTVYAKHAYVAGDWPPGVRGAWGKAMRCIAAMCRAHKVAYRAIREVAPEAMASFAHSAPWVVPCREGHPADRLAARARDFFLNGLPFLLVREKGRPLLDFVALNYYTRTVVRWAPAGRALLFGADCLDDHHGPRRFSDIGSEVSPDGLLAMLRHYAGFGLPLMVTENGIATSDEELRSAYLREHLAAVGQALAEGIDVRGYLHWTLMDNFEWALGTTARFGLFETDFATQERRPRPAAFLYRDLCQASAQAAAREDLRAG
jgi:beta-glucosidase